MNQPRKPKKWGNEFYQAPIQALNVSARRCLELRLNIKQDMFNSQNIVPDWTGLAQEMGFEYLEIQNFERDRSPTLAVLSAYSTKDDQHGASVGDLLDLIEKLERPDILMDCLPLIEKDVKTYLNKRRPCQDSNVSTSTVWNPITVQDTENGYLQPYHAFVSSCDEDYGFVQKLIRELEGNHELSLCIPNRDLLGGTAKYVVTAELIEKRCWRTILVLSPNYLMSKECDFEIKFTQALNPGSQGKKIVPVMCNKCSVPSILRFITVLDHTKGSAQAEPKWFWRRLAASLKVPPDWTESENAYANLSHELIYPIRSLQSSEESSSDHPSSTISIPQPQPSTSSSHASSAQSSSSASVSPNNMGLPQLAAETVDMLNSHS